MSFHEYHTIPSGPRILRFLMEYRPPCDAEKEGWSGMGNAWKRHLDGSIGKPIALKHWSKELNDHAVKRACKAQHFSNGPSGAGTHLSQAASHLYHKFPPHSPKSQCARCLNTHVWPMALKRLDFLGAQHSFCSLPGKQRLVKPGRPATM